MMQELIHTQCQYLGPEQDPYRSWPVKYCGAEVVAGKNYCHDHYYVVYKKGTAINGRRREKELDREIAELKRRQEIEEIENAE